MDVIGFMADMWRGLKVVWALLEVAFAKVAEKIIGYVDLMGNGLVRLINLVPGIHIDEPFKILSDILEQSKKRTQELQTELSNLVSQPMPSTEIDNFASSAEITFADLREKSTAAVADIKKAAEAPLTALQELMKAIRDEYPNFISELENSSQTFATSFFDVMHGVIDSVSNALAEAIVEGILLRNSRVSADHRDRHHRNQNKNNPFHIF